MHSMAKLKVWAALTGTLAAVLVRAMAQGGDSPVISSLQPGDPQSTVTVAVADWVKLLTLESRTHATGTGPTTDPSDLSRLRIVCRVSEGTALILSTDLFTFGPVEFVPEPWLGDVEIPWPINMDVMEADILLQGAGYQGPFQSITLGHPVYPGLNEPYYILGMTAGQYVFVGVDDQKVFEAQ